MRRTEIPSIGVRLVALALAVTACGGSEAAPAPAASVAPNASADPAPTTGAPAPTAAPVTEAPPTTEVAFPAFDAAVAEALRAGAAAAALRMTCFEQNDLECLLAQEDQIIAAEVDVLATLDALGAAASEAGVAADACADGIDATAPEIEMERIRLVERAVAEGFEDRFGEADWQYASEKVFSDRGPVGHVVSRLVLDCIDAAYGAANADTMARSLSDFVAASDEARSLLLYNLWTQYMCVDQDPACFGSLGEPDDLGFARVNLEDAYAALVADPGYAAQSDVCRTAVDESTGRLLSSLEIFLTLDQRPLVSSDTELQSLMSRGLFQIDDRKRSATAPVYPFDETLALACTAVVAGGV